MSNYIALTLASQLLTSATALAEELQNKHICETVDPKLILNVNPLCCSFLLFFSPVLYFEVHSNAGNFAAHPSYCSLVMFWVDAQVFEMKKFFLGAYQLILDSLFSPVI